MNKKILMIAMLFLSLTNALYSQGEVDIQKFLDGVEIRDICSDGKSVWFASNGEGIIRLDLKNGRWSSYSVEKGNIQNNFFYAIAVTKRFVFAGSTDGFFMMNKRHGKWLKRKFAKGGQYGNWVRAVKYDKYENAVWIGRFMYLTKYDIRRRRFKDFDLTRKGNVKTNTITTIEIDGDSLVWFGTEGGLQRYDKKYPLQNEDAITFYDNSYNYFLGEGEMVSISDILFEGENIWIGTDEFVTKENPDFNLGGLFKFDRKNSWKRFTTDDGLRGNGIYSLALVGKYIWVSTYQFDRKMREKYGRGVCIIDRTDDKLIPLYDKRIPDTVYKIFYDGENVWLGSDNGVVKIKLDNKFRKSILKN